MRKLKSDDLVKRYTERKGRAVAGSAGSPGAKGDTGDQGIQGIQGEIGPPGTTAWSGILDKPDVFPPDIHNHDSAYEPINANIQTHVISAHAPVGAQANADITKGEIEAKLTGEIATHTHAGGGGDPWTYVILGGDFTSSLTANTNVTGLNFTPAINSKYLIEIHLLLRTATATVGPRPGIAWPASLTDGGAWMQAPNSATASAQRWWGAISTQNAASTGVPATTSSNMAIGGALLVTGAGTSGNFQITIASETAGTNVIVKAGSLIRYLKVV